MNPLPSNYPFLTSRRFHLYLILACSIFFVLFLMAFLPFGVNEPKKEFNLVFVVTMCAFGGVILLTLLVNELFIRRFFGGAWTLRQFIYWCIWMIFSAGSMNFLLYNYMQSWYDMYLSSYIGHVVNVGMVLVFPMLGVFYYFRHQELTKHLQKRSSSSDTGVPSKAAVTFKGNAAHEQITR